MSESCKRDCSSCAKDCAGRRPAELKIAPHQLSRIKKVIGVVSGKGGVGKSMVTSLLAAAMRRAGYQTAILDADITGPSIPRAFGLKEKAGSDGLGLRPALSLGGVKIMSINLLLDHDTDPVVWRGPVIAGAIKQFWKDVVWEEVDFMFVDMPPGTGDVPLTVFQSLPVDGIVVVTTPQELVGMIVEKAVNMAAMLHVPVLGLVENMSWFQCPDCGGRHKIFGDSHLDGIALKHGIKVVAQLPINPALAAAADAGNIEQADTGPLSELVNLLAGLKN